MMFKIKNNICIFKHQHKRTDIIYLLSIPRCLGIILVVAITVIPMGKKTKNTFQELVILANNVLHINKQM